MIENKRIRITITLLSLLLPAAAGTLGAQQLTGTSRGADQLEMTLRLPYQAAARQGAVPLVPFYEHTVRFSAADTAVSASVTVSAYSEFSIDDTYITAADISLPDEHIYGRRSRGGGGLTWHLVPEGAAGDRAFFSLKIKVEPGPVKDGGLRLPQSLQISIIGPAVRRETAAPVKGLQPAGLRPAAAGVSPRQEDEVPGSSGLHPRLKVLVSAEGLVRITWQQIRKSGWDTSTLDPRRFYVSSGGKTLPLYVHGESDGRFNPGDYLEFFADRLWDYRSDGRKRLDIYAEQNVYWIGYGDNSGARFSQEESSEAQVSRQDKIYPRSVPVTIHEERDTYFHRLPNAVDADAADHWFYAGPVSGGEKREFSFSLPDPDLFAVIPCRIRVKLRGQTSLTGSNDIDLFFNSNYAGSGSWQGSMPVEISADDFASSGLREGVNSLTVFNRSPDGPLVQVLLDWIEITYPRLLQAENDQLIFTPPARSQGRVCRFEIEGFSNPDIDIYRLPGTRFFLPEIRSVEDTSGIVTYTAVFDDNIYNENVSYYARAAGARLVPDTLELVHPNDIRSRMAGCDYAVIVPSDSLGEEVLQPLLDLRAGQGHQVLVADLTTIYNEFNYGLPHPRAVRAFLQELYRHRRTDRQYVLLVGDGKTNNRAGPLQQGHQIPVMIIQTVKYGAAASDHWYVCLEGDDDIPEMAIGRLPVTSAEELALVVRKIIDYEQSFAEPWKNRYLLIGAGGHNQIFYHQSETLINEIIDPALHPQRLYLSGDISDPYVGGTQDLLRYLRDGTALVNFRGHGGGAIWSDGGLLDLDDIDLLENRGRLPVVTSMTCFTGDFTSGRTCLGEALLRENEAGAVAFWGATGLGWVYNDYYLLTRLFEAVNENPGLPLGALIQEAKTRYLAASGGDLPSTEVHQYTLLGDPALRAAFPSAELAAELSSRALSAADSLRIRLTEGSQATRLRAEFFNRQNEVVSAHDFESPVLPWTAVLPLPRQSDPNGRLRLYGWQQNTHVQANTYTGFTMGGTHFDSLEVVPARPAASDTLLFSARAEDSGSIASCRVRLITPAADTVSMVLNQETGRYVTERGVGPFPAGTMVSWSIAAVNHEGRLSESDTLSFIIQNNPDLRPAGIAFGGTEQVQLTARIINSGSRDIEDLVVLFSDSSAGFTAYDTLTVAAYSEGSAAVYFATDAAVYHPSVTVNPDSLIPESRYDNNTLSVTLTAGCFQIIPEKGIVNSQGAADTVYIDEYFAVSLAPGSIERRSIIQLQRPGAGEGPTSADDGGQPLYNLSIPLLPEGQELLQPLQLTFRPAAGDTSELRPYMLQETSQWLALPFSPQGQGQLSATARGPGYFQLRRVIDTDPPDIDVQIRNQMLTTGSYVPEAPEILINIKDASRIDTRSSRLLVYIDDLPVSASELAVPDSSDDPTHCFISCKPVLSPGRHTIRVTASDIHGNTAHLPEIDFMVDDVLRIKYLGNHPNPFAVETVFAYVLTAASENTSLKIYTTAGTLIREFSSEEMGSADYHEILWDGHDARGNDVANGVYFFRLRAKGKKVTREYTGKIAKLR